MSFGVPHTVDGRRIMVDTDVLDIDRRLKEGDGTLGWAGDPGLFLEFDQVMNQFVVRRRAENGWECDITYWPPPLTSGLLIRLRDADTHRPGNDPVARMFAADAAYEADEERRFGEQTAEAAARLVHALRQDGLDLPGSRKVSFAGTGLILATP